MNKLKLYFCAFITFSALGLSAQNFNLSAVGGYLNLDLNFKVDGEEFDLDNASSGFYFGLQSEFNLAEKIDFQPEVLMGIVEDNNALYLGLLGKYNVSEDFSVLFGPSLNYVLEDIDDAYSKLGIAGTFGIGYNISEDFFAQAKYSIQINNYYTGDADVTSRANFLLLGVGYRIL